MRPLHSVPRSAPAQAARPLAAPAKVARTKPSLPRQSPHTLRLTTTSPASYYSPENLLKKFTPYARLSQPTVTNTYHARLLPGAKQAPSQGEGFAGNEQPPFAQFIQLKLREGRLDYPSCRSFKDSTPWRPSHAISDASRPTQSSP